MLLLSVGVVVGSILPRILPDMNVVVEVVGISATIALIGVLYAQGTAWRIGYWMIQFYFFTSMAAVAGVALLIRNEHGLTICQWLPGGAGIGIVLGALNGPEADDRWREPRPTGGVQFRLMGPELINVALVWLLERFVSSRSCQAILAGLLGGILGAVFPSVTLWALLEGGTGPALRRRGIVEFLYSRGEAPRVNLDTVLLGGMILGGVAGSVGGWKVWRAWQRAETERP
jgi:hypothetical protein